MRIGIIITVIEGEKTSKKRPAAKKPTNIKKNQILSGDRKSLRNAKYRINAAEIKTTNDEVNNPPNNLVRTNNVRIASKIGIMMLIIFFRSIIVLYLYSSYCHPTCSGYPIYRLLVKIYIFFHGL